MDGACIRGGYFDHFGYLLFENGDIIDIGDFDVLVGE